MFLYPEPATPGSTYVTSLVLFNSVTVIFISVAYAAIYRASANSPVIRKSFRRRTRQWRKDNRKMQRRILLIGRLLLSRVWFLEFQLNSAGGVKLLVLNFKFNGEAWII